jgi:hypothetical protein
VLRTFKEHQKQLSHEDISVVAQRICTDIQHAAIQHPGIYKVLANKIAEMK